ncbi:MAG: hypothetical protein JSV99_02325 [Planctomycetota bacterium]|nr:MAG: hypothetical protein JSV99_02325 [Planctomycetota bacterium]
MKLPFKLFAWLKTSTYSMMIQVGRCEIKLEPMRSFHVAPNFTSYCLGCRADLAIIDELTKAGSSFDCSITGSYNRRTASGVGKVI